MIIEFALACCDEPEPHRKKEGDIIKVRLYPWDWGRKEIKEYLIIIVDGIKIDEAEFYAEPPILMGIIRRFKIPFDLLKTGWYPDLDLGRIRDKSQIYQPFKERKIIIDSTEKVALCWDKAKKSFKYQRRRYEQR